MCSLSHGYICNLFLKYFIFCICCQIILWWLHDVINMKRGKQTSQLSLILFDFILFHVTCAALPNLPQHYCSNKQEHFKNGYNGPTKYRRQNFSNVMIWFSSIKESRLYNFTHRFFFVMLQLIHRIPNILNGGHQLWYFTLTICNVWESYLQLPYMPGITMERLWVYSLIVKCRDVACWSN